MSEEQTAAAESQQPAESRTFTQEDVDRLIGERLARVKTAPPADYEELKAAAAKLSELEAAQLSEVDRLKKEREDFEKRAAQAQKDLRESRLETEVTAIAAKKGAINPRSVLKLLERDQITIGDDGSVTGVAEAIDKLLAAEPYLVGKKTPSGGLDGGVRNPADAPDPSSLSMDEYVNARKAGRI